MKLRVRPYLHLLKWSVYFNAPVQSKLSLLDEIELDISASMTVEEILKLIWGQHNYECKADLDAIANFKGKKERLFLDGNELESSNRLSKSCIEDSELNLTATKVQLITEGWKIVTGNETDSSTDDHDF
jgi:hypothetical protein